MLFVKYILQSLFWWLHKIVIYCYCSFFLHILLFMNRYRLMSYWLCSIIIIWELREYYHNTCCSNILLLSSCVWSVGHRSICVHNSKKHFFHSRDLWLIKNSGLTVSHKYPFWSPRTAKCKSSIVHLAVHYSTNKWCDFHDIVLFFKCIT